MNLRFRHVLTLLALATGAVAARAQVTFTMTGTAASSALGYTSGQSGTFSLTVTGSFSNTSSSFFVPGQNAWVEETTTDPQLFTSLIGTGFSGSLTRPAGASTAPASSISETSGTNLALSDASDNGAAIGITLPSATLLRTFQVSFNTSGQITFTDLGSYTDPVSYFLGYAGSYSVPGDLLLVDAGNTTLHFSITSLTITASAIPEPAAGAAIFGVMVLGVASWRATRKQRRTLA